MLRRPPWHSDLGLKCIDKGAALQGKETSCWDQHPVHIHMDKHTHRSTWKWRQSASEILHPTWGQVAGLCVVEDPVLPGSLRTHRVSQWMSTAAKRSIPEKGARVGGDRTPIFQLDLPGSLLPARFKWKAPENRRQGCSSQFRWSLRSN